MITIIKNNLKTGIDLFLREGNLLIKNDFIMGLISTVALLLAAIIAFAL